jgi:hypothetical protein
LSEGKNQKKAGQKIQTGITRLEKQMGLFSEERRRSFAISWVQMRDDIIAGRETRDVMSLMTDADTIWPESS